MSGLARHIAFLFVAGLASPAFADGAEAGWRLVEVAGEVTARRAGMPDESWRPLAAGEHLDAALHVATGAAGRTRLTNGEITVSLGPGSRIDLPDPRGPGRAYRMMQHVGTGRFDLRFRSPATLEVQTPLLIADAKGTTFTVTATERGGSVHVAEGTAIVRPIADASSVAVGIGETATLRSSDGLSTRSGTDARNPVGGVGAPTGAGGASRLAVSGRANGSGKARPDPSDAVTVIDDAQQPATDGALPAAVYLERVRAALPPDRATPARRSPAAGQRRRGHRSAPRGPRTSRGF